MPGIPRCEERCRVGEMPFRLIARGTLHVSYASETARRATPATLKAARRSLLFGIHSQKCIFPRLKFLLRFLLGRIFRRRLSLPLVFPLR